MGVLEPYFPVKIIILIMYVYYRDFLNIFHVHVQEKREKNHKLTSIVVFTQRKTQALQYHHTSIHKHTDIPWFSWGDSSSRFLGAVMIFCCGSEQLIWANDTLNRDTRYCRVWSVSLYYWSFVKSVRIRN